MVSDSPAINGIWTKDFEQHDIRFYHHERLGQWALDIRFPSHFFNSDRGARAFVFNTLMNRVQTNCIIRLARTLDKGLLNLHPLANSFWNERADVQEWIVQDSTAAPKQVVRPVVTIHTPLRAHSLFKYKYTTDAAKQHDVIYVRSQGLFLEGIVIGHLPFLSLEPLSVLEDEPEGEYMAILASDIEQLFPDLTCPIDLTLDLASELTGFSFPPSSTHPPSTHLAPTHPTTTTSKPNKTQKRKRSEEDPQPNKQSKAKDVYRVNQLVPMELPPNNLTESTRTTLGKLMRLVESSPDLPDGWDWIQYLEDAQLDIVLLGPQSQTLSLSLGNGALETKGMNMRITADKKDKEGNIVRHNMYYSTESRIIADTQGVRLKHRKCQKTAFSHGVSFSAGRYKRESTAWAAWFIAWVETVKVLLDLPVPKVTEEEDIVIKGLGVAGCSSICRNTQRTAARFMRDVDAYDGLDHSLSPQPSKSQNKAKPRQTKRKHIEEAEV